MNYQSYRRVQFINTLATFSLKQNHNFSKPGIKMDFDPFDIREQNIGVEKTERRQQAIKLYESISRANQDHKINSNLTVNSKSSSQAQIYNDNQKGLTDDDGLLLLNQAALGKKLDQIRLEFEVFSLYSNKQLQNLFSGTLSKLCRIWFQVLPKHNCQIQVSQYQKSRLKNPEMLAHYKRMGLNISELFQKLMILKNWRKQYAEYLMRGYHADYMPENIISILGQLPDYFHRVNSIFDECHFSSPKHVKKSKRKVGKGFEQVKESQDLVEP